MIIGSRSWVRHLPAAIQGRIAHRPNLQKMLENTGWLFADRLVRMGMGLLVGVWVARYLGPDQFGLYSYAIAFVALFGSIATLGLNGIVVRDLVKNPEEATTTIGTAFVLQLIGGLLVFVIAIIAIGFVRPDEALVRLMVAVLGFVTVFKATEVIKYWFESQIRSKHTVLIENAAFLLFAAVKVALITFKAPLIAFVWIVLAEAVLVAVCMLYMYMKRVSHLRAWKFSGGRARELIGDSWPYILSGVAVMLYMRIDQIMLGQMLGNKSVGIYSVAVRLSEVWYFIPVAIVSTLFPAIIDAKKQGEGVYRQRLQELYDLMAALGISVAVFVSFFSNWIVNSLFGSDYEQAGRLLSINTWAGVFVFLGLANGKNLLLQGLARFSFYFTLACALLNITLNYILIPRYGVIGSAFATLLSQMFGVVINFFPKLTRPTFWAQIRAIFFWRLLKGALK